MGNKKYKDKMLVRNRLVLVFCVLLLVFSILSVRLSYIMIFKRQEYAAGAEEQWTSEVKIYARRGRILDRNGRELAVSANVYRLDFDLNTIRKDLNEEGKTTKDIAPKIAEAAGMDVNFVQKKLDTRLKNGAPAGSATLIRRIEKEQADKVKALKIRGIIVSPDTKRYYPNNNFASHLIGTTNIDGKGLTGIELQYNRELSGLPGMKIAEIDRISNDLPYTISKYTPPVNGKDLTLTIDENIQFFAEKAAEKAFNDNKAKSARVLVTDPKTGEILAMATKPDFDPNNPYEGADSFSGKTEFDKIQKMWRNPLVNDTFEPGSIFKVITAIGAIEEGVVTPEDKFVCNGSLTFGNRKIKCWKTSGHGTLTFPEIIQNSCNVGFMKLGEKLGKDKLYEYIKKFGFGNVSGIDLPGEAKGIIKSPKNISATDLATISFGQTNTVNSVQFMSGFNAIANGGTLIQPHIMKEISHEDDNSVRITDEKFSPETKTVAKSENTAELRKYLERVVTSGSAKGTFIEGYHIGGKTGTAQKVNPENGTYERGKYVSSFAGMAPVDDPKVTVMITVDEPSNGQYYAGVVTSPIAKMLFTDIFNYMDAFNGNSEVAIKRDVVIPEIRGMNLEEAKKVLKEEKIDYNIEGGGNTVSIVKPYPGYAVKEGTKINIYTEGTDVNSKAVIMPDLKGYSKESATKLLKDLGITPVFEGVGNVKEQAIPNGELVNKGTSVKLTLNSDYKD